MSYASTPESFQALRDKKLLEAFNEAEVQEGIVRAKIINKVLAFWFTEKGVQWYCSKNNLDLGTFTEQLNAAKVKVTALEQIQSVEIIFNEELEKLDQVAKAAFNKVSELLQ
jgi:hypothetical protein